MPRLAQCGQSHRARHRPDGSDIATGKDGVYPWQVSGLTCIDSRDASGGVRASQDDGVKHSRLLDVIHIRRDACYEPWIFLAPGPCANERCRFRFFCRHGLLLIAASIGNASSTTA
jgi:hypothetical protein